MSVAPESTASPAGTPKQVATSPKSARPRLAARDVTPPLVLALMVCVFYTPHLLTGTTQWDGIDVHYSTQRYFSDAIRAGHLPFWTPYVFSGFPFLADVQVGAWYPLNWPFFVAGVTPDSIDAELLLHGLIACGGAYALALRLTGQRAAALASGVFYGLSGYFAGHSQHVGMVQTAAWLPWLVLVVDVLGEHLDARRLALAGVLGALVVLPGHFQTALYAACGVGTWAVLDALWRRSPGRAIRVFISLLVMGAWGVLLSAIVVLPGLELVRQSLRTQLDAAEVGLGYFQLESLFTLVQPNYYGVLLDSRYTGPGDVTQHYFYASVLLVPLAVLGLRRGRVVRMALFLGLPFVWYALGPDGGLFNLLVQLPGFASVELPMHGWFLPALGLALLGGAGLGSVQARLRPPGLVLVLALLFVDVFVFNSLQNRLTFARHSAEELYYAPLRAFGEQLAEANPPVRRLYGPPLAAVVYRNHALQSRVEATYGYNPLELLAFANYADAAESNPRLIDGLAASHRLVGASIEPIPSALPLAYFARSVTSDVALADLDPAQQTLLSAPLPALQPDPTATVVVQQRGEDNLALRYRSSSTNMLRIAIPLFPGWHASLDGIELPVLRVDRAFIGVVVPPGDGEVRLWYAPRYFWLGAGISAAALLGTIAVLLGATSRLGLTR